MVTNAQLNANREPSCYAILTDKKYFHSNNTWIKRTLRRHEWQSTPADNTLIIPAATYPQRWKTDAAVLQYLSEQHTDIPLPRMLGVFEDNGAFYHCTEHVPGVLMSELREAEKKREVMGEVLRHVKTLKALRSDTPGVPGQSLLCPPQRVTRRGWKIHSCWRPREDTKGEYVFCHNDLGQHNIIVDPETLKINAIIDWEFGGFWPEWFERPFWERPGPSAALDGEDDDVDRCREWLLAHFGEVVMPHLEDRRSQVAQGYNEE